MQEVTQQAVVIARAMWHRRWIGLITAWIVAVAGAIVVSRIPDRFEASAKIYVDTQTVLRPLMAGLAIQPDVNQIVAMMARTMITRPNVERLMRMADLDLKGTSQGAKDRIAEELIKEIKLSGGKENNLYSVSYRDTDPQMAQKVVQSLVSMFVESGLRDKRRDTAEARKFIDEQIAAYEKKLEEAENRVKEFKIRNLGVVGDSAGGYYSRATAMNEELVRLRAELKAAEESRDSLRRELSDESMATMPDVPAAGALSETPELDARIDVLRKQLDELNRRYTDQHPDVVSAVRMIERLQDEKTQEIDKRRKAIAQGGNAQASRANPVVQQLKIAQAEAEANVAALRARVADVQGRVEALKSSANRVPQIETEFAQMNRDYEIMRRNYDQLVTRRESASMSEEVDTGARLADFRVIDPPRVSPRPVFPNRLALVPLILAAAVAAGVFASFAVSQIFPTVQNVRMLRSLSARPVLGSVSMQMGPVEAARERRWNVAFAGGVGTLVVLVGCWTVLVALKFGF